MTISLTHVQKLTADIVPVIDVSTISADLTFMEAGLDSLDTFTLFLKMEEIYGFSIPEMDVNNIKTFQDLLDYSNKRIMENI